VLESERFVSEFVATARTGADALASLATNAGLPEQAVTLLRVSMDNVETWIAEAGSSLVVPIAAAVTVVILGGFLTFYVLHDSDTAWSLVIRDLPERHRRMVTAGATRALDDVGAYMRSTG